MAAPNQPVTQLAGPAKSLVDLLGKFVKVHVEPRCNNLPLWESELREVAETFVVEQRVPNQPVSMVDLARACGLLKSAPRAKGVPGVR